MKAKHTEATQLNARQVFIMWNISPDQDFHVLSSSQVDEILKEADRVRYQKPRNANGSRARYFYERMQRHARRVSK